MTVAVLAWVCKCQPPSRVPHAPQLWESWVLAPSVEQAQEVGRGGDTGRSPQLATDGPVFTHLVLTFCKSFFFFFPWSLLKAFRFCRSLEGGEMVPKYTQDPPTPEMP